MSATKRVTGEAWPPEAVREVLEAVANDDIDQEFAIGLFNRRGVTTRMATDGGGEERDEAAKYRSDAKASGLLWPLTFTGRARSSLLLFTPQLLSENAHPVTR